MTREELLKIAKPILFNTEMVQAISEGRKTVTRRVVKTQPDEKHNFPLGFVIDSTNKKDIGKFAFGIDEFGGSHQYAKPPFKKGDYLYVRETWNISNMCADGNKVTFIYRGDKSEEDSARTITVSDDAFDKYDEMMYEWMPEWRPSIHMPKAAARIFLKVTDVRVERLQDMKHDEVMKEGIHFDECPDGFTWKERTDMYNCYITPTGAMKSLWNSTIKKADLDKYGWDVNPWVWVIEFERVEV